MNAIQAITTALQQGRPAEAEQRAGQALQQSPDNPDLLLLHALAQHQQGKIAEALEGYARLTELCPDQALHWGNYATALRDAGEVEASARACEVSLQLNPDNPEQLINRGLLLLHQRDFPAARDSLIKAVALAPASPAARIHAARTCAICHDYRTDELVRDWRAWLPLDEGLQLELADVKLLIGDVNSALALLEDLAARVSRPSIALRLLLATVYERINRTGDAQRLLDTLQQQSDTLGSVDRCEIAHLQAMLALRRGALEQGREQLETAGPRSEHDFAYYFALAEACDKLGDSAGALDALGTAHELQVAELKRVVPFRFEPDAPVLPNAVARVSAEDYHRWPSLVAPDADASPIFIVGFPRSGTTLLEQMLDAHPHLQSMDEQPFFNTLSDQLADYGLHVPQDMPKLDQYVCDELRKGYLSLVCGKIQRRWDTQLVDKNPLNMLWLPLIHRLYPKAKFILALRHPCDVLVSNYLQNFRAPLLAAASESFEKLAQAYVAAMRCWLDHVAVFQPDLLVSRYEELVADPVAQTRRLGDFLGLADTAPLLQFDRHARDKGYIATPSYTQVIAPVNRKGLNRWHRYREALTPVLPILQPMLGHWGYSVE